MNHNECIQLRDLVFSAQFLSGPKENALKERAFRFLAVEPGNADGVDATVHYAYSPATWERAELKESPDAFAKSLIEQTPFRGRSFALQYHDYLRCGWPLPWGITAKESVNNFPTLVLREMGDGSVSGAVMRDPHCGHHRSFVSTYVEPEEADVGIKQMQALAPDQRFMGWYKDCNVEAKSLVEAIESTPETESGQKYVLLYRDDEWFFGLWNNPINHTIHGKNPELSSFADFHGTPVSSRKRNSRANLDAARLGQVIAGNYDLLGKAIELLDAQSTDYESHPAVKTICDWWNAHAPKDEMRHAGAFRLYVWSEDDKIFTAGDPEEPAIQSDTFASIPTYALFEREGEATVAVVFFRGRQFNTKGEWGTQTHYANGEAAYQIGEDLHEVDEAYYSIEGLQAIRPVARHRLQA